MTVAPLRVADLMTRYVEFLDPEATVQDAAVMMGELDVGALPIGSETKLEGVITDRDILYRVVAGGLPGTTPVRQVMSSAVVGCKEADGIPAVLDLMASHHLRRMPVFDAEGKVVGWVTIADLSRRLLVASRLLQDSLRDLTETDAAG